MEESSPQRVGFARIIPEEWMLNEKAGKCPPCGLPKSEWKRRKDWRCHSTECTQEYVKTAYKSWPDIRRQALKRDNYTCVECGDSREFVEVVRKTKLIANWRDVCNKDFKPKYEYKERKEMTSNLCGDHIVPIALGGDEFDLKNVQTLCIECHKIKTKEDISKIAARRRIRKLEEGNKTLY